MKVYDGSGTMKIAVFFSGGASSGKAIIESPGHGKKYQTVCTVTNNEGASAVGMYRDAGIEVIFEDPDDYEKREEFYEWICKRRSKFKPDVLAFSGWGGPKSIVSGPLFTEYKNRAFNVHPGYLGLVWKNSLEGTASDEGEDIGNMPPKVAIEYMENRNMTRKLVGEGAGLISFTMLTGENHTASTVFALKKGRDDGPCIIRSPDFPFDMDRVRKIMKQRSLTTKLQEYAKEHQEAQKWRCDCPVFVRVMELAADGGLDVDIDTMEVSIYGKLVPYGGRILGPQGK